MLIDYCKQSTHTYKTNRSTGYNLAKLAKELIEISKSNSTY